MKKVNIAEIFNFCKKSKLKAGDGLDLNEGKYPFYTSSSVLSKSINECLFDGESLIFGTGGQASLHYTKDEFSVSTGCFVLQPKLGGVKAKYVYYYLKENIKILEDGFKGAGLKHISKSYIQKIKIPLPDLATQQAIVKKLDAAQKLCDLSQAIVEKYEKLSQSLFLEMFGDPVTNPKGWEVKKLKFITTKIGSGATPKGGKESYKKEGISLIRSMNVYDRKFKYTDLAFIDEEQAGKLRNVEVNSNDVLFNITGASVCRCTVVPEDILPARVNQHVSILRADKNCLNPDFLNFYLISPSTKFNLLKIGGGGGAVMEAITKEKLENFEILLPPIELQNQFAEHIAEIERQKALAEQELAKSQRLFAALLQESFS